MLKQGVVSGGKFVEVEVNLVSYVTIDSSELDRLGAVITGIKDFSVVAEQEWSNDESHTVEIKQEDWFSERFEDRQEFMDFLTGRAPRPYSIGAYDILSYLAEHTIIDWGKYLVVVSW